MAILAKILANDDQMITYLKNYTPSKNFPAGVRQYSNTSFALLSLLISRMSAMSYTQYIQRTLFAPLQMDQSGFLTSEDQAAILVDPHSLLLKPTHIDVFGSVEQASGGIYSNADDMLKFIRAVLRPETTALAGAISLSESLGLGWDSLPGKKPLWKNGGMTGFGSQLEIDLDQKQGAFVVVDNDNTLAAMAICDLALGGAANDQIWNVDQFISGPAIPKPGAFEGTYISKSGLIKVEIAEVSKGFLGATFISKGIEVGNARLISAGPYLFWVDTGGSLSDRIEFSLSNSSSGNTAIYSERVSTGTDGKPVYDKTKLQRLN